MCSAFRCLTSTSVGPRLILLANQEPLPQVEGSEWWKGRTREGREGWFPRKWVQVLERRKPIEGPPADAGAEGKVQKGE